MLGLLLSSNCCSASNLGCTSAKEVRWVFTGRIGSRLFGSLSALGARIDLSEPQVASFVADEEHVARIKVAAVSGAGDSALE